MYNFLKRFLRLRSSTQKSVQAKTPTVDHHFFAGLTKVDGKNNPGVVAFDEKEIYCTFKTSSDEAGTVKWSDLHEVDILTTAGGPVSDDFFWILSGENGSCVVPGRTVGCDRLLARLQQLSGFNNMEVIRAMGSTTQARFVCWRRSR